MATTDNSRRIYEDLADQCAHTGQAKMRDWFLVLAADEAHSAGRTEDAERLRQRLLQVNPHHLLRPYATYAEAIRAPDVLVYVQELRRNYPRHTAGQLLEASPEQRSAPAAPPVPPGAPPRQAEKPLAQPAPFLDESDPMEPELKVFRVQVEPEDFGDGEPLRQTTMPLPAVRPAPAPAPRPPAPLPRAKPEATAPRPQPGLVHPIPLAEEPKPARVSKVRSASPDEHSAFLPRLLFGVLLVAGLGLAIYSFARPFLPETWFR